LQFFARGGTGREGGFTGGQEGIVPAGQRRRRDAQLARNGLEVLAAQQPEHRSGLALSRHPAPERRCARLLRSLRSARSRSNAVLLIVHDTPLVRKSSACEVSQSTVMRGTSDLFRRFDRLIGLWHGLPRP